jgi:DNA-3-methyladenine glycosylase I
MTADDFRRVALSLPQSVESSHMRHPDFRVGKRIFATLGFPGDDWGMVKLTPQQQRMFVHRQPEVFKPVKGGWGRGGCTNVILPAATEPLILPALIAAWRNVAPRPLAEAMDDPEILLVDNSRQEIEVKDSTPKRERCAWARTEQYILYHDREWGVPVHDDRLLFEFLILEGAQAGLSWETILKKRENYRAAFDRFDPKLVAKYGKKKVKSLLADAGIVRNRLKIEAAVVNARAFIAVQDEFGSFDAYIWRFVDGKPVQNAWKSSAELPARNPQSDMLSKDLNGRGFKFVGTTICYAFMQAVGMVNDHFVSCFRHAELAQSR